MAKRSSAMRFLNDEDDANDRLNCDSSQESPLLPDRLSESLRAHSPSPIRKRGSLLNIFSASNSGLGSMGLTNGMIEEPIQKPKRMTVQEIEASFQGEIPDTPSRDLPPTFSELQERKRIETQLFIEKMDH